MAQEEVKDGTPALEKVRQVALEAGKSAAALLMMEFAHKAAGTNIGTRFLIVLQVRDENGDAHSIEISSAPDEDVGVEMVKQICESAIDQHKRRVTKSEIHDVTERVKRH